MTTKLERMAEEYAELETVRTNNLNGVTVYRTGVLRGYLAGAKALLEYARSKATDEGYMRSMIVKLEDLETFFTEE